MCDTCSKLFLINDQLVCWERLPAGHNPFRILLCPAELIKTHSDFSVFCDPCTSSFCGWRGGGDLNGQKEHGCAYTRAGGGKLLGLRPCLWLLGFHRETQWSNRKPKDSVPWIFILKFTCYCPVGQSISIHGGTQREMFVYLFATPHLAMGMLWSVHVFFMDSIFLKAWDLCRDCCQYHPLVVLNNNTLHLFSTLTVCKQIYNLICKRHLHSTNT